MDFKVLMNTTYINGASGQYDGKVKDANVKYGRNAISNYQNYLNVIGTDSSDAFVKDQKDKLIPVKDKTQAEKIGNSLVNEAKKPPVNFSLKYLPEENVSAANLNKMALMGAAFEDLGKKISVPLDEINKKVQDAFGQKASAKAFDTNNDGQIDVSENAAAILIKDMADKQSKDEITKTGTMNLKGEDIKGSFTQKGEDNFGVFLKSEKADENKSVVSQIQQAFKLDEAKNIFLNDKANLE